VDKKGSPENAVEAKDFALKDSLIVVDDFAPGQQRRRPAPARQSQAHNPGQGQRLRLREAHSGPDCQAPLTPEVLLHPTGEDVSRGRSLRARMLIVEVGSEGPEWERLTSYQRDAREEQGGLLSPSAVILLGVRSTLPMAPMSLRCKPDSFPERSWGSLSPNGSVFLMY
jgi:hypothetical protein